VRFWRPRERRKNAAPAATAETSVTSIQRTAGPDASLIPALQSLA
jgi:hypothetical protein